MELSPELREIAAQLRALEAADALHAAFDDAVAHGAKPAVAASVAILTSEPATVALAAMSGSRHSERVWSSESDDWHDGDTPDQFMPYAVEQRRRAARQGARTRSRRAAAIMRADEPASAQRLFDGTMARAVDGGIGRFKPGVSATYGAKPTERPRKIGPDVRKRTFTVTLMVRFPDSDQFIPAWSYADDQSPDRAAAKLASHDRLAVSVRNFKRYPMRVTITESGSEPVTVPVADGERAPVAPPASRKRTASKSVTADPYTGGYAAWRRGILNEFRAASVMLAGKGAEFVGASYHAGDATKAARWLQDYWAWANRRYAACPDGYERCWARGREAVSQVIAALRAAETDAELREIAETLGSPDMGWMLPA